MKLQTKRQDNNHSGQRTKDDNNNNNNNNNNNENGNDVIDLMDDTNNKAIAFRNNFCVPYVVFLSICDFSKCEMQRWMPRVFLELIVICSF